VGDGVLDVWPDNAPAVAVFEDMLTSWNVGPGGVVGLRYETLPTFAKANGIKRKKWRELIDGLKVMESAALQAIRAKAKAARDR